MVDDRGEAGGERPAARQRPLPPGAASDAQTLDQETARELARGTGGADDTVADAGPRGDRPAQTGGAAAAAQPDLRPGARFDRFVILDEIGAGAMGIVVAAYDERLDRRVAIKLLRPELVAEADGGGEVVHRLTREAQAMAKLSHPNVVTVYEVGTAGGGIFIVMEYVEGRTLAAWLRAHERGVAEILDMFASAGRGLAAAHRAGIVHRDFKPENVLVGDDGRVRVSDFGLAGADTAAVRPGDAADDITDSGGALAIAVTRTGARLGTPRYMAPEQHEGRSADSRADQFSFCVALYEALYGELPFAGKSYLELYDNVTNGVMRPIPREPAVPEPVRAALVKGLQVARDARFSSLDELLPALAPPPPRRRSRAVWAAAAAAVCAVAIAAAWMLWGRRAAADPCALDPRALAGIWDGPSRAKIRAAFSATGDADAEAHYERAAERLGNYSRAWLGMRRDACEATRVRGEQSQKLLDLRMLCLDRRRDELAALVRAFEHADRHVVSRAETAALGLSSIAACANTRALLAPVAPPGKDIRALVERMRKQIASVKVDRRLGRIPQALVQAEAITFLARSLSYPPLEAEALLLLGDLQDRSGHSDRALATLDGAVVAAEAGNARRVGAEAWETIGWIQGYVKRDFPAATQALRLAGAALASVGGDRELMAQLVDYRGLVFESEHELHKAERAYLRALGAQEQAYGKGDWRVALVLNDLGGVERRLGQYDAAQRHLERALAIRRRLFGDHHYYVISSLINLGNLAWSRGDYSRAERYERQALAAAKLGLPAGHPRRALILGNLGDVLKAEGKYVEAAAATSRAIAIYRALPGRGDDVADALHDLAGEYAVAGDTNRALRVFAQSLAIYDRSKRPDRHGLVQLLADYGKVLGSAGSRHRAEALLRRAVAVGEKGGAAEDRDTAGALTALGQLYLASGRARDAVAPLEAALKLDDHPGVKASGRAETELALAKALWRSGGDRRRARALARAAAGRVDPARPGGRKLRDAARTWLAHPR